MKIVAVVVAMRKMKILKLTKLITTIYIKTKLGTNSMQKSRGERGRVKIGTSFFLFGNRQSGRI